MKITRRQVLYQKADQIEREAHRGKPADTAPEETQPLAGGYMQYLRGVHDIHLAESCP